MYDENIRIKTDDEIMMTMNFLLTEEDFDDLKALLYGKSKEGKTMMPVECVGCIYEKDSDLTPPCVMCSRYHQGEKGYENYEDFYKTLETKWQSGTEPKKKTTRTEILETAIEMVNGSRTEDYGIPEDNFSVIAKLWSAYYGCDFSAHDVAMMMGLLKVGRISNAYKKRKYHKNSYVDGAGYFSCAAEIAERGCEE